MTAPAAPVARVLAPVAALVTVLLLDVALAARNWPIPVEAALDEPAHLLTAWLLLSAAGVRGTALLWALAGSVLIDLDHVPLYLGAPVTAGGGRPVSHSLAALVVLLALAWAWRSQRTRLGGLAAGVGLHVVRDLASGPGVPLLWPLLSGSARVPYALYVGVLVAATVLASWQAWRSPSRAAGPPGRRIPDSPAPR
jgi:inner membrane protein